MLIMEDRIQSLRQIFRIAQGHSIELCSTRERVSNQGSRTSLFYQERDSANQVVAHYRVWTLDASTKTSAKHKKTPEIISDSRKPLTHAGISHNLSNDINNTTETNSRNFQSGYEKFSPKGELQDREIRYGENWLQERQLH